MEKPTAQVCRPASVAPGGGEFLIARFRVEHSALSATLRTVFCGVKGLSPFAGTAGYSLLSQSDKCNSLPGQVSRLYFQR